MYHWRHGWYFKRNADASVVVTAGVSDTGVLPDLPHRSQAIPPEDWASIVAAVSANREDPSARGEAFGLHMSRIYEAVESEREP